MGSNPIARSNFLGTDNVQVSRPVNPVVLGAWILIGALIPVMSLYGRDMQRFMRDQLEGGSYVLVLGGALVVAAGASVVWLMRRRSKQTLWLGLLLLVAIVLITQLLHNPTEWIHFVLFGAFGLLATLLWRPSMAIAICLLMSGGDELFQWFLPDRVGDPRDVLMNIAACLLGASVALSRGETE